MEAANQPEVITVNIINSMMTTDYWPKVVGKCALLGAFMSLNFTASAETTPEMEVATPSAEWVYQEIHNPFINARTYLAHIDLPDADVELRCSALDRQGEIRVNLPNTAIERMQKLHFYFDKTKPRIANWKQSLNGYSLVLPRNQHAEFSRKLKAYHTLHLELQQNSNAPSVESATDIAKFAIPLKRSSKAISKINSACRFPQLPGKNIASPSTKKTQDSVAPTVISHAVLEVPATSSNRSSSGNSAENKSASIQQIKTLMNETTTPVTSTQFQPANLAQGNTLK